jgi:hypothetical protein
MSFAITRKTNSSRFVKKDNNPYKNHKLHISSSYILSISTTPIRLPNLLKNIDYIEKISNVYKVIINFSQYYHRLKITTNIKDFDLSILDTLNKKYPEPKYIINNINDYGPITKFIGGYKYINNNYITDKFLVILDDDTIYDNDTISILNYINTLYNIKNENYLLGHTGIYCNNSSITKLQPLKENELVKKVDIIEGYGGIFFNTNSNIVIVLNSILQFIRYYKTIHWDNNRDNIVNNFLINCFISDDFVISYFFNKYNFNLYVTNKEPQQHYYGFLNDALHKSSLCINNNLDTNNNYKRYLELLKYKDILQTFLNKIKLCNSIIKFNRTSLKKVSPPKEISYVSNVIIAHRTILYTNLQTNIIDKLLEYNDTTKYNITSNYNLQNTFNSYQNILVNVYL